MKGLSAPATRNLMARVVRCCAANHLMAAFVTRLTTGYGEMDWPGWAVELAEKNDCVLVVVDSFPANTKMIPSYALCVTVAGHGTVLCRLGL